MTSNLSQNEFTLHELCPATTRQLAETMGISVSYVYDLVENIRRKGYTVKQDSDGRYFFDGAPATDDPQSVATTRIASEAKSTVTRDVKRFLAEAEHQLVDKLTESDPPVADGGLLARDGGTDLIIHRTDDHFGEEITNQHGEVTFNSEVAEQRVYQVFDEAFARAEARADAGEDFDTAHLLLGGDIVTNEAIYEGQAQDIDETLEEQIHRATSVYIENIKLLADWFPTVQVVCQPGNHGRLGTGNSANADNIVYMMLDKALREAGVDNVSFVHSSKSYYVDFSIRDWSAHLRHGHDSSLEHIGTSAGKQRWLSWLVDHDFDVAFRGHYHMLKEEPINGTPVVMGGSIIPQTDFEESHGLSGRAIAGIHGATDDYPIDWTERITFG